MFKTSVFTLQKTCCIYVAQIIPHGTSRETNITSSSQIHSILWSTQYHYRFHKRPPPPLPVQNQITSAQCLQFLSSVLILSSRLRLGLPSGLFSSGFFAKILHPRHLSPEHVIFSACIFKMFRYILLFNGGQHLAPRPNPNLKDHLFSAVRDGLLNIFTGTLSIWKHVPHMEPGDASFCGDRRLDNTANTITRCSCR